MLHIVLLITPEYKHFMYTTPTFVSNQILITRITNV